MMKTVKRCIWRRLKGEYAMKKRLCLLLALMLVLFASAALAACEGEEDHRYGSWKTKTSAT